MLVFAAGFHPIYGQQLLYIKNPEWLDRASIRWPEKSDTIPGSRKDYKAILGESGGTLSIPHIEKKPEEQESVEEVSEAERAALAAAAGDLDAVAGECKPFVGCKPTGEGKYDTSARDAERSVIGGLMGS